MLGALSVNTHFPGRPAVAAASAAAATWSPGRPARSAFESTTSLNSLVSLSRLAPKATIRRDRSALIARRRCLCSGPRVAPPRTKRRYVLASSVASSALSVSATRPSYTALTRRNSASLSQMSSAWAASSVLTCSSTACNASFVSALEMTPNTLLTRVSISPASSSATTVLASVGAASTATIAAISASCRRIAARNAGRKCSGRMRSNGGMPNGALQSVSNGLSFGAAAGVSALIGTARASRRVATNAVRIGAPSRVAALGAGGWLASASLVAATAPQRHGPIGILAGPRGVAQVRAWRAGFLGVVAQRRSTGTGARRSCAVSWRRFADGRPASSGCRVS